MVLLHFNYGNAIYWIFQEILGAYIVHGFKTGYIMLKLVKDNHLDDKLSRQRGNTSMTTMSRYK